ncbi:formate dehydrogenase subunit alpha [Cytobacillus firmus]|uniref:formate dehydrogenase subunit alpha n=1 Tax=Cytobacillus firmus TaxID=1399 RepID=UPI00077C4C0C|nr:formate dehydrogenase subunit alpha [Cytobacillus firmus]MBG9543746.1 oxidoreductase [Cytobacillus firmus]MBG9553234.1 oxidoreductase [Cytobacillus firmus]MBG9556823.1 oxidoreductase [Cytobacillus firmus]MBG9574975.1 oxidoreductase [Cytobacillus firmus]MEC1895048.1 formate dehydrogenase subunit alpha [Cytobacillus firmus]
MIDLPPSLNIKINGIEMKAEQGQTVLQLLNDSSIEIPQVCFHPSLGAIETCDTCIVSVNGELVRSCSTKIKDGDVIDTVEPDVKQAQTIAMDKILFNHELYCTVCDYNNGGCEVHNTVKAMKINHQSIPFDHKPYEKDESHPFYRYDPDQCILCGRCVEACQDVQVTETLTIDWERERPRVIWDNDVPINESSCVSCGHCSTVCPCNAMMEKGMEGEAGFLTGIAKNTLRPMIEITKNVETGYGSILTISDMEAAMREEKIKKTKTVCTYCGVGCSFDVWTKGREILKVEPQAEAPANGISTCVKGKFGWDFVNSEERLTKPLIREGDSFREAEWDEALDLISRKFSEIKEQHGPDALSFISSSKCTNEESYLMQKLGRAVIGTNNIDNCSRYCQTPATVGLFRTVGYGGDAGSIEDIKNSELVLIIGSNTSESHPVLSTRVKRSQKLNGQKVIVADLREHEMAERSDLFVRPRAGTDMVWLSAITKYIIDQGWADEKFLQEKVNGLEVFVSNLEKYTLEFAEETTGISRDNLIKMAEMIHEANSVSALWAMGVTQHLGGSDTSTAISNLLLVTGNYAKPGAGAYPLRGHNNVQGAGDFGSSPDNLPGYQKVSDPDVRKKFENAWGVKLPEKAGMNNHEMVEGVHEGQLKAMYLKGEDMGLVDSNINYVQAAFEKLDFFVVQDIFLSRTAEFADVVLPASPSLEKEGTFTNTERRIQRLYQAFEPLGDSKPDWEIIIEVANRLGAGWTYTHPSEIMAEAARLMPLYAGVTYDRLEGYNSLQWPVAEDGTDTPLLYTEGFPFPDGKARLFPVDWTPALEYPMEYDIHVNNGRLLEHFHEGNMTYKSKGITSKTPEVFLEVSPELAEETGLKDGTLVRLTSPYGNVKVKCHITDRVKGKEVYLPMNDRGEAAINLLTSSYADKDTDTPAYKEIKVKLEILSEEGINPLPRINHRYGNPKPQIGVNVQKKWARKDYIFPGEMVKKERKQHG